ncbi:hypothetical protein BWI96_16775 [Siphonobacter sp. SORGH_AS_0500]|uniref:hypothetical protein n=1 Tax=Siphonobacter sp. SORGH_AS_0500 TaxID=1864824 RepID=UPI000CAD3DC9|nr:hypothetical protein [Siphonobacter sp. SORGH_AS_0500]PKK35553.1 hypothetical protein BWI96_16775 [Siphonobacter sp. SORGH_AS_0500]
MDLKELEGLTEEQLKAKILEQSQTIQTQQSENDSLTDKLADAEAEAKTKDLVVTIKNKKYRVLVPKFILEGALYSADQLEKDGLGEKLLKVEGQQVIVPLT